ncbi:probable serine/threonine-protein kinase yakA [Diachasma alloeum]|uniref:probable serine/threonine-protein kinase yakA n=1 Tax=Diachasma alloeum TaxID=454923 RepID=UPI000738168D|nr:probable serine/threonine-protein kinase yakA [Diachasma alloeum]
MGRLSGSRCTWRETPGTCVLESEFGFTLNCAFKKSGLFRVRNLGGVKGYVGLGLSVGDELGFRESLSNLESSKRRSVQTGQANFIGITNGGSQNSDPRQGLQGTRAVPPFKPLPPGASRPMAPQPEHQRLVVQQNSTALKTIPAPSLAALQDAAMRQHQVQLQQQKTIMQQQKILQEMNLRQQQKAHQDALAVQILKEQKQQQAVANKQKLVEQQQMLNLQTKRIQIPHGTVSITNSPVYTPAMNNIATGISLSDATAIGKITKVQPIAGVLIKDTNLPAFVTMPPMSSAQLTNRLSNSHTLLVDSVNEVPKDDIIQLPLPSEEMAASVNEMTLQSLNPNGSPENPQFLKQQNEKRQTVPQQSWPSLGPIHEMGTSLKALAEASNITLEALEAAILLRQKQLMEKHQGPTTTSTTTTTQSPMKNNYNNAGTTKVMNAPREYYPMGYDKNFDDNFASRVDLPDTSFYCGDQKHFPGLYADEDLGCMVFHVCALTDDGLIMKSFLCPESTLFDQTILKCNWWFYVECKNSKSLYDSNIPISKSYQLMKALAFFSAYKNHDNATSRADKSGS